MSFLLVALRHRRFAAVLSFVCVGLIPSEAFASQLFDWSTATDGVGVGYSVSIAATINQGDMVTFAPTASEPSFVAQYAGAFTATGYVSGTGVPANITSTWTFSGPLPAGAKLVVIDVDVDGETLSLSSGGVPLTLLDQLESKIGATSNFPNWTPPLLSEMSPTPNNNEASIFDLSGLSSIDVDFTGGSNGSGVALTVALPDPQAVPSLPDSAQLVLATLFVMTGVRLLAPRFRGAPTGAGEVG